MKKIILLFIIATSIFANVEIKSIDIFKNRVFLNQKIDLNKKEVKLLTNVRLEDIRFKLENSCKVVESTVTNEKFKNDELSLKIEKLKDEISIKNNKIRAFKTNIEYLKNASSKSGLSLKELKLSSAYLKKEILENYNKIYTITKEIKVKEDSLNELHKKREKSEFSRLKYSINCPSKKSIIISYPFRGIKINGFYDLDYDSKMKKMRIKKSSFITQSTGIDFKNIAVNLHTYNYTNQLTPRKFYPDYLDISTKRERSALNEVKIMSYAKKSSIESDVMEKSADYYEGATKSFFKASNIGLKSGEKTEVVFANDKYSAKNSIEIDGFSQSKAFYKVAFKSKKLYGTLNAKVYLDGNYVGKEYIKEIKKEQKSFIYFGENSFVDVKKELIKDMKEEPFFSSNKLKTQKIWRYKITNRQNQKNKITLLERLPISKHEDIEIKLIGETKNSKVEQNGKVHFEFELSPNEERIIEFGYEVLRPNISKK